MIKLTIHNEDAARPVRHIWINPDQIVWMIAEDWKYYVEVPGKPEPAEKVDRVTHIRMTDEGKTRVIETPEEINNAAYYSKVS